MSFASSLNVPISLHYSTSSSRGDQLFFFNPKPTNLLLRHHLHSRSVLTFARRKSQNTPVTSPTKKKKKKKSFALDNVKGGEDNFEDDPFEALFNQLEEDLKNDNSSIDDDDITEEDIEALAQELAEALGDDGDIGMLKLAADSVNDEAHDEDEDDVDYADEDEDEPEDYEKPVKLKNWQLRRLAYALKAGRRKTSIKNLAADLCLERAVVLELLREPPPNLLMMSAALPDKPEPTISVHETKSPERIAAESELDAIKNDIKEREPIHVMQHRWSAQKKLKKVQLETLERVYRRSKRPTNALISSVVQVTNLPRKKVVKWFEDKRVEDGIPDNRRPYQRSVPDTVFSP